MIDEAESCAGKIRHPDTASAYAQVKSLLKSGKGRLKSYHCRFCGGWHVGHLPKSAKTRPRRFASARIIARTASP